MSTSPNAPLSTRQRFLARIEAFLKKHGMAVSRFGELACNDRSFVQNLRQGRRPNADLMDEVDRFMTDYTAAQQKRAA